MIRAVFLGTPEPAVPALASLMTEADVTAVVTQPPRRRGRGLRPTPSPVARAATAWELPVIDDPTGLADTLAGCDIAVVAAYGRIITADLLEAPASGFLNVHFSLLPRWRGASPVERAILAGDDETGVTLMRLDEGLDTGPVYAATTTPVLAWDTGGTLTGRLAGLGADLLARTLNDIVQGRAEAVPQDDAAATAAAKISVDEAFVDPSRHTTVALDRAVRAFHPRPGAWTMADGRRLKLLRVSPTDTAAEPGRAALVDDHVVLGAVGGAVRLDIVQPEGSRPLPAVAWMHGRRGAPARLGPPSA